MKSSLMSLILILSEATLLNFFALFVISEQIEFQQLHIHLINCRSWNLCFTSWGSVSISHVFMLLRRLPLLAAGLQLPLWPGRTLSPFPTTQTYPQPHAALLVPELPRLARGHPRRPEALSPANTQGPEGAGETLIRYTAWRAGVSSGKCRMFVQREVTSKPGAKGTDVPPSSDTSWWLQNAGDMTLVPLIERNSWAFWKV